MKSNKIGIIGTSSKPNERRLPIYPDHIKNIDKETLSNLYFEKDYGKYFNFSDKDIINLGGNILERSQLFNECDIMLITKPTTKDLDLMHDNQILCGWVHSVQQYEMTQIAIDKKLTFMAMENMYGYHNNQKGIYLFARNRELAGYCSVLQFLQLLGIDGMYGPRQKVVVFGFGMTSRGAIYALQGRGFNNIHVYTQRPTHFVADKNPNCYYHHFNDDIINEIKDADIIVNCILQDVNKPIMYISNRDELSQFKENLKIIDVSCDENMGFYFAKPTNLENPILTIENNVKYYGCDHSPSYLYNAATREISLGLLPYLNDIVDMNENNLTIKNSYDIKNGIIINENIIKFQKRNNIYPYQIK